METTPGPKNILGLQLPTDPRWVDLASISLEDILTDHAWCEQKAATSCISLIQRYPSKTKLVTDLAPIVSEEWGHFRLVLAELEKRNLRLGPQRKDQYVNQLMEFERKGGSEEARLLDRLLIFALIEARYMDVNCSGWTAQRGAEQPNRHANMSHCDRFPELFDCFGHDRHTGD